MNMIGIYKITNKYNYKNYIGKSKNIMQRWATHEQALLNHTHHSIKLQSDYDIYGGIEAFDFSILEICTPAELNEREKYYINEFDSINNGYNGNEQNTNIERKEIILTNETYKELQNRIDSTYLMTYLYLRFNAGDNNQIVLNQTLLAEYFDVTVLTISKHIRALIDNGIIKSIGKSGLYNKYEILL